MDAILSECIRLAGLGVPCHWLGRRSKVPLARSWSSAPWLSPSNLCRTYRTGFNFGIHTGKVRGARFALVVVDLDSVRAVEWANHNLPLSPVRALTKKGEHWYYAAPEGGRTRAKVRIESERLDIDVRGDGGQVVAPPSVHPDGYLYAKIGAWDADDFDSLPVYTDSWFPPPKPVETASPRRIYADNYDLALKRGAGLLRAMVRKGEVYPRGEGHGTKTFTAARILICDFGLTESQTFDLLAQFYNPACPQPYNAEELRRKVTEAATKGRSTAVRYLGAGRG